MWFCWRPTPSNSSPFGRVGAFVISRPFAPAPVSIMLSSSIPMSSREAQLSSTSLSPRIHYEVPVATCGINSHVLAHRPVRLVYGCQTLPSTYTKHTLLSWLWSNTQAQPLDLVAALQESMAAALAKYFANPVPRLVLQGCKVPVPLPHCYE